MEPYDTACTIWLVIAANWTVRKGLGGDIQVWFGLRLLLAGIACTESIAGGLRSSSWSGRPNCRYRFRFVVPGLGSGMCSLTRSDAVASWSLMRMPVITHLLPYGELWEELLTHARSMIGNAGVLPDKKCQG